jgi:hypothetical protein
MNIDAAEDPKVCKRNSKMEISAGFSDHPGARRAGVVICEMHTKQKS